MMVAAYHTGPQVLILVIACVSWLAPRLGAIAAGVLGLAILVTFSMALALFFSRAERLLPRLPEHRADDTQFLHFLVPMMYPSPYWRAR